MYYLKMKIWYAYKMEYYLALKKNGVKIFARKWIDRIYNIKGDYNSFRKKKLNVLSHVQNLANNIGNYVNKYTRGR